MIVITLVEYIETTKEFRTAKLAGYTEFYALPQGSVLITPVEKQVKRKA